jgi:hypothetical protein
MSAIIGTILSFVVQAFALKAALSAIGKSKSENEFSTALVVALSLNVAFVVLGLLPLAGSLVYLALWVGVIMKVYRVGFLESLGVGMLQFAIRIVLGIVLWLFGWIVSLSEAIVMSPF